MQDLPVALSLPAPLRDEVAAYIEVEAGWQVVGLDGPPRPAVVMASEPVAGPGCVVIVEGPADPEQMRAALQAGALDVIAWPAERARLLEAPSRLRGTAPAGGPPVVRVAGARGGVGTSTVALALAGLTAWAGRRVVVVGDDGLCELCGLGPWRGPGAAEILALAAPEAGTEVDALSRPVPAVPGLAVLGGGGHVGTTTGWPADLVVVDAGTDLACVPDLVCTRPGPGLGAAAGAGAPVVVVGDGPLGPGQVRRALAGAFAGWLATSARVARAGALGRVPAFLPGSWLCDVRLLARFLTPSSPPSPHMSTAAAGESARGAVGPSTVAPSAPTPGG